MAKSDVDGAPGPSSEDASLATSLGRLLSLGLSQGSDVSLSITGEGIDATLNVLTHEQERLEALRSNSDASGGGAESGSGGDGYFDDYFRSTLVEALSDSTTLTRNAPSPPPPRAPPRIPDASPPPPAAPPPVLEANAMCGAGTSEDLQLCLKLATEDGVEVCRDCPENARAVRNTIGGACECNPGFFALLECAPLCCRACPAGTDCANSGTTIFSLPLKPGFFRLSDRDADVRRCADSEPGETSEDGGVDSGCAGGVGSGDARSRCAARTSVPSISARTRS